MFLALFLSKIQNSFFRHLETKLLSYGKLVLVFASELTQATKTGSGRLLPQKILKLLQVVQTMKLLWFGILTKR